MGRRDATWKGLLGEKGQEDAGKRSGLKNMIAPPESMKTHLASLLKKGGDQPEMWETRKRGNRDVVISIKTIREKNVCRRRAFSNGLFISKSNRSKTPLDMIEGGRMNSASGARSTWLINKWWTQLYPVQRGEGKSMQPDMPHLLTGGGGITAVYPVVKGSALTTTTKSRSGQRAGRYEAGEVRAEHGENYRNKKGGVVGSKLINEP